MNIKTTNEYIMNLFNEQSDVKRQKSYERDSKERRIIHYSDS